MMESKNGLAGASRLVLDEGVSFLDLESAVFEAIENTAAVSHHSVTSGSPFSSASLSLGAMNSANSGGSP